MVYGNDVHVCMHLHVCAYLEDEEGALEGNVPRISWKRALNFPIMLPKCTILGTVSLPTSKYINPIIVQTLKYQILGGY